MKESQRAQIMEVVVFYEHNVMQSSLGFKYYEL